MTRSFGLAVLIGLVALLWDARSAELAVATQNTDPSAADETWTGTWATSWTGAKAGSVTVIFIQDGNEVTGEPTGDVPDRLPGFIDGGFWAGLTTPETLVGEWVDDQDRGGTFTLTLGRDGTTWSGPWTDVGATGTWSGRCIAGACLDNVGSAEAGSPAGLAASSAEPAASSTVAAVGGASAGTAPDATPASATGVEPAAGGNGAASTLLIVIVVGVPAAGIGYLVWTQASGGGSADPQPPGPPTSGSDSADEPATEPPEARDFYEENLEFWTEEARTQRRNTYAAEWARATDGPLDPKAFDEYVRGREEFSYTQLAYETWHDQHPTSPPHAFLESSWYQEATGGHGAIDVSIETIDAVLLLAEGPGLVKAGWDLTKHGAKVVRSKLDEVALRNEMWDDLVKLRESWAETAARVNRDGGDMPPVPSVNDVLQELDQLDPRKAELFIRELSEDTLKTLYDTTYMRNLTAQFKPRSPGVERPHPELGTLHRVLDDMGLPTKWHGEKVNRIARGTELPPAVRGLPPDQMLDFAQMFLDNNGHRIEGTMPSAQDIAAMWTRAGK